MNQVLNEIKQFPTYAKEQSISMQRKLIVYWMIMIMAVFAVVTLILGVAGVFSHSEKRVHEALHLQQQNTMDALELQLGQLNGRCMDLSERISAELSGMLFAQGKDVDTLNGNPELITQLEEKLYPLINTTLQYSDCSGAFFMLDASGNLKSSASEYSRMGIYLRDTNSYNVNTLQRETVYYRGDSAIAEEEAIQIHEKWNQEFDSILIPEYERMSKMDVTKLEECCRLTGCGKLADTEEDVMLLCVPILDDTGKICGICGVELSGLYFRLSYPVYDSSYGSMLTLLAPMEGSTLILDQAMFGSCGDIFLRTEGALTVQKEKYYNVYSSGEEEYIGLQKNLEEKTMNGNQLAAVTILPENYYNKVVSGERKIWILGSALFFLLLLSMAWLFTRYFMAPIYSVLTNLREDKPMEEYHSGITELDDLARYIQEKAKEQEHRELPPNIEILFQEFSEKVAKLTPMERTVLQFYIDGYTIEEVAARAFISVNTVKKHNTNINRKLEVSNREELMLYIDLFRRAGRIEEITYHSEL